MYMLPFTNQSFEFKSSNYTRNPPPQKNQTKQNKKQLNKQIKNPSKGMLDEATVPTADSKKTMRSKCVQQKLEGGDEEQTGC